MAIEYQTDFLARIERTPASVSYRFKTPRNFSYKAGQYMLVDIGNDLVHPLTISNCPEENEYIEFTKRMTGSPYCSRLESLKKGDTINVQGPIGRFYFDYSHETVVMIAGGIGITPIRSILTSLDKKQENQNAIILLYGNLNKDDIAFKDELENIHLEKYRLVHVLSDTTGMDKAYKGFIDVDIISKEVPEIHNSQYMISGPPVMVEAMKKVLSSLNVDEERIRTDMFLGYL